MKVWPGFILVAILYSCSGPVFPLDEATQTIKKKNQLFCSLALQRDTAAFAAMHHSEAIEMPPDTPEISGRTAIAAMALHMPATGASKFSLYPRAVYGGIQNLIEEGKYEIDFKNKPSEKGKYIMIWRPENDDWKIYRAIWNKD